MPIKNIFRNPIYLSMIVTLLLATYYYYEQLLVQTAMPGVIASKIPSTESTPKKEAVRPFATKSIQSLTPNTELGLEPVSTALTNTPSEKPKANVNTPYWALHINSDNPADYIEAWKAWRKTQGNDTYAVQELAKFIQNKPKTDQFLWILSTVYWLESSLDYAGFLNSNLVQEILRAPETDVKHIRALTLCSFDKNFCVKAIDMANANNFSVKQFLAVYAASYENCLSKLTGPALVQAIEQHMAKQPSSLNMCGG